MLPQSPWIINGERKAESSIEELICDKLCNFIKTKGTKNRVVTYRASSSYFFLFFSAYSYFSYFFAISSYFSYFLANFTYNKQIFVRDLNIFKLVQVCCVQSALDFFHKIVFIIPEMFVLIINKV